MSELLIIEPISLSFLGALPTIGVSGGTGGANLLSYDPREIWQTPIATPFNGISIDLGVDMQIDAVYLGNTNADAFARFSVTTGTSAQGAALTPRADMPMQMPVEDERQPRGSSLFISPEPIVARYISIGLFMEGAVPLEVGNLIIGRAYRPFYNKERGAQRVPFDSGSKTRLSDGSLATVTGALISGFKWVFGDLSQAEANALWGIIRRRKTTEPVVVIEDLADLSAESIHYCTLIDLQPYARLDPRKTRWELSVEDWL